MNKCFNIFRKFLEWNSRLAFSMVTIMLIIIYCYFFSLSWDTLIIKVFSHHDGLIYFVFGLYIFIFLGVLWLMSFKILTECKWYYFWPILYILVIALSLCSVLLIDNIRIGGDSRVYYACARVLLKKESFSEMIASTSDIYYQRPLFFLFPVFKLFGSKTIVYELYNIFLNCLIGFNIYWLAKQWINKESIARIATVFYYLIPSIYLVLNLPTHEYSGMLYILLLINISTIVINKILLQRHISWKLLRYLCPAILLGIIWFLIDMIRISIQFVIPIFGVWFLGTVMLNLMHYRSRRLLIRYFIILVVTFIIPLFVFGVLKSLLTTHKKGALKNITCWVAANQSPRECLEILHRFDFLLIPNEKRSSYVFNLVTSYFAKNTKSYLLWRGPGKMKNLSSFDLDHRFVEYGSYKKTSDRSLNEKSLWKVNSLIGYFLQITMSLFIVVGLYQIYLRGNWLDSVFAGVLFTTIFILFLSYIGEVYPRYMSVVYGFIFIFAGIGFSALQGINYRKCKGIINNKICLPLCMCLIILLLITVYCFKNKILANPYSNYLFKNPVAIVNNGKNIHNIDFVHKDSFTFNYKNNTVGNEAYKFSWSLENLVSGREYNFNGFLRILEKSSQVVEIIINDEVVFSSVKNHKQFVKSKKNGKYLLSFMHDLKFTAKEKNTLTLKFSNPGKDKVTYDASLLGVHVSPRTIQKIIITE